MGRVCFFKDNQEQGFIWTTAGFSGTIQGQALTLRIKITILQKDATISVNGVNHANTIVVQEKYEQFAGGVWNDITSIVGYYKSYYAKGVGLIKQEYIDEVGAQGPKIELYRSNIY